MKSFKHEHGTRNPILAQEEHAILLTVEKALASSPNSQTIGRNGELPFLWFLQRYLPQTLKAVSGHFITPAGVVSPQLDVIVVDARYPLLAENADGSALVMLHSVIRTFEIKTNLKAKDIQKSLLAAKQVELLANEVPEFGSNDSFSYPQSLLLAYNCAHRLSSLEKAFFSDVDATRVHMDAIFLRYHKADQVSQRAVGGELHLEPSFPGEEGGQGPLAGGYFAISRPSHTPLSDLYYSLVQDSYYTLGDRNFSFHEIGAHFNDYMNWSTAK
jgi:hypothetical protein